MALLFSSSLSGRRRIMTQIIQRNNSTTNSLLLLSSSSSSYQHAAVSVRKKRMVAFVTTSNAYDVATTSTTTTTTTTTHRTIFGVRGGGTGSESNNNNNNIFVLPSSIRQGLRPSRVLVEPGQCQFTEIPRSVPLLARYQISKTSYVLRFGLPDPKRPLNLSTCACLLAVANITNNTSSNTEQIIRPYTPITTNRDVGYFDLLVKNYGPIRGKMSHYLCEVLQPGVDDASVSFQHIPLNVKVQAPFQPNQRIAMIVGGTGITPMIQALHAILGSVVNGETDAPKVIMLYGSREADDILGKEILDQWTTNYPDHFQCIHILSHESANNSTWQGLRGYINEELIQQYFPKPSTSTDDKKEPFQIFICGPPSMYETFCGPRNVKEVTGLLGKMGYTSDQVYKF